MHRTPATITAATITAASSLTGGARSSRRGQVPGTAWVRTDIGAANVLLERNGRPYAAVVPTDAGRVIALADERLFTNASLVVGDNAALLADLIWFARKEGDGYDALELVGEDTGLVARTPIASVARGRLAPFLLQLGTCLILFLLLQGRAFGRLVDPDVARRRVFAEHVRAVGTQYARARAAGQALSLYAPWAVERLRERIRLPGDRSVGDLAAMVAGRTGRPLGDVARILFSAQVDDGAAPDRARDGRDEGRDRAARRHEEADEDENSRAAARQHLATMRELGALVSDLGAAPLGRSRATTTGSVKITGAVRPQEKKTS